MIYLSIMISHTYLIVLVFSILNQLHWHEQFHKVLTHVLKACLLDLLQVLTSIVDCSVLDRDVIGGHPQGVIHSASLRVDLMHASKIVISFFDLTQL